MPTDRLRGLATAVGLCLRADRAAALGCMVLFTLRPLALVFTAYGVKLIVDAAARHDTAGAVWFGVAIATVNAVGFIAGLYGVRLAHRVMEATAHAADRELIALALGPPGIAHHERRDYLDNLDVLSAEQNTLSESADVLALLLGATLRAAVTVVLLSTVSPWLLLIAVFAVPVMLAGGKAERLRQAALTAAAPATRQARHLFGLATSAAAAKELRVYGLQDELRGRHASLTDDADRVLDRAGRRAFAVSAVGWLVFTAGYGGAGLLVARGAARGELGIGDVVMVLTLLTSVVLQMTQTMRFSGFVNRSAEAGRRLLWLRAETPAAPAAATAPPDALRDGIELRQLSFRYPGGSVDVLNGIDLRLPAGSVVGLVGENGSGKSTLVKLLTKMYDPTSGGIFLDGTSLDDIDADDWRARVTGAFQDFARLELTVQHTVGVGQLSELDDEEAVRAALRRADAEQLVDALPAGPHTELGHSFADGTELSGGQWQRLALARGMMRDSPLLLVFDEPTAAIDAETERLLLNRYAAEARATAARTGAITILVSHRFTSVRDADLIVVLDHGNLAEVGTHAELRAARGAYAQLYELQAQTYQ
jgi:ABC-type multidrug transport system fused ATPase/permease subunit